MRRLNLILLALIMSLCFTASAMAAQPKGWEQPRQQLAKLVIVAKGGNCTGEPTRA